MRRSIALFAGTLALLLSSAGSAQADSVTIDGSGSIDKMSVNNKDTKIIVKIFAPGGSVNSVEARVKDEDGTTYNAVIINGPSGDTALYEGGPVNPVDAPCENLAIGYNTDGGFWRFAVPRSCLAGLAGKIKARGLWADAGAPGYSQTAWTPWVRRG